jgi:hypothetical protein
MRVFTIALAGLAVLFAPLARDARAGETTDRLNAASDLLTDMMNASDKGFGSRT